jgi:hypothetical protein
VLKTGAATLEERDGLFGEGVDLLEFVAEDCDAGVDVNDGDEGDEGDGGGCSEYLLSGGHN